MDLKVDVATGAIRREISVFWKSTCSDNPFWNFLTLFDQKMTFVDVAAPFSHIRLIFCQVFIEPTLMNTEVNGYFTSLCQRVRLGLKAHVRPPRHPRITLFGLCSNPSM